MTRPRNLKLIGASLAMAGGLAIPSGVAAETERPPRDIPATSDARPTDRVADVEVLHMKCAQLEPGIAAVECSWRRATHPDAVGYQLWRIIDRGHREPIWRGGLDATSHTSRVPADASVARYAVLAVNQHGRIVGRSRVQTVRLRLPEPEVDVRPIDVKPIDRAATDSRPVIVKPVDIEPVVTTRKASRNILRF